MSKLFVPGQSPEPGEVGSNIDLNDEEIKAIESGPMKYMRVKQSTTVNLEQFRKDVIDQFANIGFTIDFKTFKIDGQPGVYAFGLTIIGKNRDGHRFDPEQMVHEVTTNMLELPDKQEGVIKTNGYAEKLRDRAFAE